MLVSNSISKKRINKIMTPERNPGLLEFLYGEGYELIPHRTASMFDIRIRENNRYLGFLEISKKDYEVTISYNHENSQQIEDALNLKDICENSSIPYHSNIPKKQLVELIRNNFGNINGLLKRL